MKEPAQNVREIVEQDLNLVISENYKVRLHFIRPVGRARNSILNVRALSKISDKSLKVGEKRGKINPEGREMLKRKKKKNLEVSLFAVG